MQVVFIEFKQSKLTDKCVMRIHTIEWVIYVLYCHWMVYRGGKNSVKFMWFYNVDLCLDGTIVYDDMGCVIIITQWIYYLQTREDMGQTVNLCISTLNNKWHSHACIWNNHTHYDMTNTLILTFSFPYVSSTLLQNVPNIWSRFEKHQVKQRSSEVYFCFHREQNNTVLFCRH